MNEEIKVWAQMFFDDGSVTEGLRINATIFDEGFAGFKKIALSFLTDTRREEGLLLIWGAGDMYGNYYTISSLLEIETSEFSPEIVSPRLQKRLESPEL